MGNIEFITKKYISSLPTIAGVYLFYDKTEIIYIGKAINIKDRVKNHFFQPTYKDDLYIKKVEKIGFIETRSEIEALILEASLIKKYQPKFNAVWRDDKNYFYVAVENKKCPIIYICHQKKKTDAKYIGPFTEGNALKKTLKFLRKVFPYYTHSTGSGQAKHPKNNCQWCNLGLCPGLNPDLNEYKKNIKKLVLILEGKRKTVLYKLKKEMADFSARHKFEEALKVRDKISALEQVMAHSSVIVGSDPTKSVDVKRLQDKWQKTKKVLQEILNLKTPISKIECYDISNTQGMQAVGSMVVFVNGKPDKSQYKKFRIRMENKPNDIAMLGEVLSRRLAHPEWGYPQVMLIDGGKAQLNVAINSKLKTLKSKQTKNIKITSIAKGQQELFIEENKQPIPLKQLPQEIYNLILHLDDEAHRFAITYHKKLRKKALLQ